MVKDFEEIVVLSVNISSDFDGGFEFEEHGLRHEDLSGFDAKGAKFRLLEFCLFGFTLKQFVNCQVDIDFFIFLVHTVPKSNFYIN